MFDPYYKRLNSLSAAKNLTTDYTDNTDKNQNSIREICEIRGSFGCGSAALGFIRGYSRISSLARARYQESNADRSGTHETFGILANSATIHFS